MAFPLIQSRTVAMACGCILQQAPDLVPVAFYRPVFPNNFDGATPSTVPSAVRVFWLGSLVRPVSSRHKVVSATSMAWASAPIRHPARTLAKRNGLAGFKSGIDVAPVVFGHFHRPGRMQLP